MDRVIVIVGPTAVGKTKVSIDLAEKLQSEIISGDSMLLYRGMDIGTAKPSPEERRGIRHHLIDILDPDAEFSVVDFQAQAGDLITAINRLGKIPVIAGGTGLYIKALLEGYQFNTVPASEDLRKYFTSLADKYGSDYLHQLLAGVSPETASKLHPNDLRRIIRALEIHHLSGGTVSRKKAASGSLVYDAAVFGLTMRRDNLYERINARVDTMLANGLLAEVKRLLAEGVSPDAQAMQGIGYKEMAAFIRGETDFAAAVSNIKQASRNFAKRQLTFFRRMPYIAWIDGETFNDYPEMLAYIYNGVAGKFNLRSK